jgi:surface polysaccharide O-acyltransferase-like enzyme
MIGMVCIFLGAIFSHVEPPHWNSNFYKLGPAATIYHIGIVGVWLCLCHVLVCRLPELGFFKLLSWLSRHIPLVYCIQWIIILWMFPLVGYHRLNVTSSIFMLITTSIMSFGLAYLILRYKVKLHPSKA